MSDDALIAHSELAEAVGAGRELAHIAPLVARHGSRLAGARGALLLLREGDDLVTAAGWDIGSPPVLRLPLGSEPPPPLVGSPTWMPLDRAGLLLGVSVRELGVSDVREALIVGLAFRSALLGVMLAFAPRTGPARDVAPLVGFAAAAANAIAFARDLAAERLGQSIEAAERERTRWARELHDDTLQQLAAIRLALAARSGEPDAAERALLEQADEAIAGLRRLIADLRPPILDELGLGAALQTLVQRQVRSRDVDAICSLRLHYEDGLQATRLTAVIEDTVYRCVQEAVNNALKHSGSPTVSLEVVEGDGWLHVAVRDAGRGFTVAAPARGFGLLGMRERLSLVGGTVAIDCPPRGGTTVAMYVPAEHRSV